MHPSAQVSDVGLIEQKHPEPTGSASVRSADARLLSSVDCQRRSVNDQRAALKPLNHARDPAEVFFPRFCAPLNSPSVRLCNASGI